MVDFITGLNSSGGEDLTDPNYWNWNGDNNPATNATDPSNGQAHKWTPGSTVTYWFDPGSN